MAQDINDFLAGYVEEVQGYLPAMRTAIGELQANPRQQGALKELHRLAHIIRGASAMVGIDALSRIAGHMENALEQVLDRRRELVPETLAAMEATVGRIQSYCQDIQQGVPIDEARLIGLTEADFKDFDANADTALSLDSMQDLIVNEALPSPEPDDELMAEFRAEGEVEAGAHELPASSPEHGREDTPGQAGAGSLSDSLFSEEEKRLLHEGFREEAEEHFQQLHASMRMLAAGIDGKIVPDAGQEEEIRKIRRSVHTIKGASAVIGLRDIAAYAHGVEDFLDWLYEGPGRLDPETL
jgi:chemosensory pili system protein ChpA (sensor histidine kinase/response regulator)